MGRGKHTYLFIYGRRVLTGEYQYSRTNSKGEAVFRRDTNQNLEEVKKYLKEYNIKYEDRTKASALKVYNKDKHSYIYYWTTGRWKPYNGKIFPHYRSNSIEDFVINYLNRFCS